MSREFHPTVPRQFLAAVETHAKPDAFRHRKDGRYLDVPHREVLARVHALACAVRSLGLGPGDRAAILSENRLEWAVTDLALLSAGCVSVPIYPTLLPPQVEYILRDSETRAIFVSSRAQMEKVHAVRAQLPLLKRIVVFDADAADDGTTALDSLLETGRPLASATDYRAMINAVAAQSRASVIYTSGTTGEPKGVILTHANFMANVRQCLAAFDIGPTDTYLSFLPLSHVFERTAGFYVMMTAGVTIAYAESLETVARDMLEARPTVVLSVPRLYEKMYARIFDAVAESHAVKRRLFVWAVDSARRWVREYLQGRVHPLTAIRRRIASALVFRAVRARVGGRVRFFVSGSAPLAHEINEFFYAAGLPILEGYGLTEASPVVSVNNFSAFKFGTVGRPLPGVEIKIADDGEILARGANVMQGYLNKPEQTAETIIDGWLHTGDIGHLDEGGFLVITDRKKDLIVTAGGKKVAPQPIELRLKRSPFVEEAVLVGDRRPFVVLLIVPDFARLESWAAAANVRAPGREALLREPAVRDMYQKVVDGVNADLAQFERIKVFTLLEQELTTADGALTQSLKVRRKIVQERFRYRIDAMYGGAAP